MKNRKENTYEELLRQAVTEGCLIELRTLPAEAELVDYTAFLGGFWNGWRG